MTGLPVVTSGSCTSTTPRGTTSPRCPASTWTSRPASWSACSARPAPGKSTLLSLLGGLFRPSAGKIFLGDPELSGLAERDLDGLRATRDLADAAGRGPQPGALPRPRAERRVRPALDPPATPDGPARPAARCWPPSGWPTRPTSRWPHSRPGTCSSPRWRSRWPRRPGLLLADEPTSQLDHAARDLVLQRSPGSTGSSAPPSSLVTHDPAVAPRLPRTVTIRDGRIGGEGRLRRGVRRGDRRRVPAAAGPRAAEPAARHAGAGPSGPGRVPARGRGPPRAASP